MKLDLRKQPRARHADGKVWTVADVEAAYRAWNDEDRAIYADALAELKPYETRKGQAALVAAADVQAAQRYRARRAKVAA